MVDKTLVLSAQVRVLMIRVRVAMQSWTDEWRLRAAAEGKIVENTKGKSCWRFRRWTRSFVPTLLPSMGLCVMGCTNTLYTVRESIDGEEKNRGSFARQAREWNIWVGAIFIEMYF